MRKLLIILAVLLTGCISDEQDCLFETNEIIRTYDTWIKRAENNNGNIEELIIERDKKLEKLNCE